MQHFSLKVTDIFESDSILDSNIGYIPFKFFKKFIDVKNDINTIELHMSEPLNANKIIMNAAKNIHNPLFLYTWINSYKNTYHDIKIIKSIVYLSLFLLVIVSCFSIASISFITISKKTREIAILRSMGANNFLIQLIFLYYGLRSIILGSLIGLFSGVITILNFKTITFYLKRNFEDSIFLNNIYYNNFLLLKLNFLDVIIIFISTVIIGIITNWYPAYFASKIRPSNILKEY